MQQPNIHIDHITVHVHGLAPAPSALLVTPLISAVAGGIEGASIQGKTERFELSADGLIVTDHTTGLMWPVYESEHSMDYDDLEKYVAEFRLSGFDGWFNPGLEQRESIRDLSRCAPALFAPLKSRSNGWEWTATPYVAAGKDEAGVPSAFWQVCSCCGSLDYVGRGSEAFARPCRFVARAGQ